MSYKGVNLGGWLLMEGYILGGRNIAENEFKNAFARENGAAELAEFERLFRENFITRHDFANIRKMGANAVRVPFNHGLVEKRPFQFDEQGFVHIDNALSWAAENKLGVILDLHAAGGAQNCDWHSDSSGRAMLGESEECRKSTCALWGRIADRYKDASALIGYDVLNEPVIDPGQADLLKAFYSDIIKSVRLFDKKHVIFLEGNMWGQQIDFLNSLLDQNVRVSIHTYSPLNFTFNFIPCLYFPGRIDGELWNENRLARYLEPYRKFARASGTGLYVGEFGVNWRGGHFGELKWLDRMLKIFDDLGFDYTYWTYKSVASTEFPDGIYQFIGNNAYVRREGPLYGFENYTRLWKTEKRKIVDFWRTDKYTPNKQIISVLKKHFSRT